MGTIEADARSAERGGHPWRLSNRPSNRISWCWMRDSNRHAPRGRFGCRSNAADAVQCRPGWIGTVDLDREL
jgi:hypothetical protein